MVAVAVRLAVLAALIALAGCVAVILERLEKNERCSMEIRAKALEVDIGCEPETDAGEAGEHEGDDHDGLQGQ